jgi:hypothetical protein
MNVTQAAKASLASGTDRFLNFRATAIVYLAGMPLPVENMPGLRKAL